MECSEVEEKKTDSRSEPDPDKQQTEVTIDQRVSSDVFNKLKCYILFDNQSARV